jgi:hypothetical protein
MCSRTKEPHRVTYSIWHVSLVQWKGLRDQGTAETLVSTFMFILRCADLGMCVILGLSRVLACIDNDMKVTQINIKGKHKKRQLQRNRISTRKVQSGYIADQQRTTKVEMVEHVAKKGKQRHSARVSFATHGNAQNNVAGRYRDGEARVMLAHLSRSF